MFFLDILYYFYKKEKRSVMKFVNRLMLVMCVVLFTAISCTKESEPSGRYERCYQLEPVVSRIFPNTFVEHRNLVLLYEHTDSVFKSLSEFTTEFYVRVDIAPDDIDSYSNKSLSEYVINSLSTEIKDLEEALDDVTDELNTYIKKLNLSSEERSLSCQADFSISIKYIDPDDNKVLDEIYSDNADGAWSYVAN